VVNNIKTDAYMTPAEVAALLLVSPVTVRQWAQKGWLNAETTPGGHRRFMRSEVERFARQRGMRLHKGPGASQARILIVDDDRQVAGYLQDLLSGMSDGVVMQVANNGFEAGYKIRSFKPHAVLLDLRMPGLDGFTICTNLKSNPETEHIRIVAMTGYYTPENVERIRQAGADECLAKPFDPDRVLLAIRLPAATGTDNREPD
jgi:excisionase family DNA binding protein